MMPLSSAQAGIWYAQQLHPDNPMYNTGEYVVIQGHVDAACFEASLRQAVAEAESLNMVFGENEQGPGRRQTAAQRNGHSMSSTYGTNRNRTRRHGLG